MVWKPVILNQHISARNPNRKNAHLGGSGPLMSEEYSYALETSPHFVVYGQTNGTNTQHQSTGVTMEKSTQETLGMFPEMKSQSMTFLQPDFHARLLALQGSEGDLKIPEGLYSLKSLGFSPTKDQDIFSWRTSRVCLVTNLEKLSQQYLGFSPTWGIELNGWYLTASTLEFPKTGKGCSLSDIEKVVRATFFL